MSSGWLWSGLGIEEWLLSEGAQVVFSFLLVGLLLTPGVGWLKRALDPTTKGGAGSRIVAGRETYLILAEVKRDQRKPSVTTSTQSRFTPWRSGASGSVERS